MRGLILVVPFLLVGLLVVPNASAASCGRSETTGAEGHYVQASGIRTKVWQETNGLPGLQTSSCTSGGKGYPADRLVFGGVPSDLGILGICTFTPVLSQCW